MNLYNLVILAMGVVGIGSAIYIERLLRRIDELENHIKNLEDAHCANDNLLRALKERP